MKSEDTLQVKLKLKSAEIVYMDDKRLSKSVSMNIFGENGL